MPYDQKRISNDHEKQFMGRLILLACVQSFSSIPFMGSKNKVL